VEDRIKSGFAGLGTEAEVVVVVVVVTGTAVVVVAVVVTICVVVVVVVNCIVTGVAVLLQPASEANSPTKTAVTSKILSAGLSSHFVFIIYSLLVPCFPIKKAPHQEALKA